jgi:hypothetical protein
MQMFSKELTQAGHTRRFTISDAGAAGWEVKVEQDSRIIRQICYTDWHRVERALQSLAQQVLKLQEEGWRELSRV